MKPAMSWDGCRTPSGALKRSSGVRMGIGCSQTSPGRGTARLLPYIRRYGPLRKAGPAAEPLSDLAGRRGLRAGDAYRQAHRGEVPGSRRRAALATACERERVLRLPGVLRERALQDARDRGPRRRHLEPGVAPPARADHPQLEPPLPA